MRSFFHQEQPPTGGERSNAAPSAHHPSKGGERSKAAGAQAVHRRATVTRAPRSRARLIPVTTRRRLVAKPRTPHLHCAARAALQAANSQCRGSRGTPLAFLWGMQRGYSLRKENTPFVWQWRKAPHDLCSAARCTLPPPCKGGIKRETLFEKRIPPLNWQWRKAPH